MIRELELLEFLNSRFCHDMAGPIGAVSNGSEFLREDKAEMRARAADLIEISAKQAVVRLEFYKYCFGTPITAGEASIERIKKLCDNFLDKSKFELVWSDSFDELDEYLNNRLGKIILNLLLVALSGLIYGGKIELNSSVNGDIADLTITGTSDYVKINKENFDILRNDDYAEVELSTSNAQFVYTKELLSMLKAEFGLDITDNMIKMKAKIPLKKSMDLMTTTTG